MRSGWHERVIVRCWVSMMILGLLGIYIEPTALMPWLASILGWVGYSHYRPRNTIIAWLLMAVTALIIVVCHVLY
jgi:hypothetical protein